MPKPPTAQVRQLQPDNHRTSDFTDADSNGNVSKQQNPFYTRKQVNSGYEIMNYDEMRKRGSVPSAPVYDSLIQEYCKKGCMKEAVELVNEMIGLKHFPVASTFNGLINGFCKQAKVGIALRLMEDLTMRGYLPDSDSYGFVVDALCSEGDLQQVFALYMQMMERGIAPSNGTWNSLIMVTIEGKNSLSEHKLLEGLMKS